MKRWILYAVCIVAIFGRMALAADNIITWTGLGGSNGMWSDSNNWLGEYLAGYNNLIYIDATGNPDPRIDSTVTTPLYYIIRIGYGSTSPVAVNMTGGTLQTGVTTSNYISFADSADARAGWELSGGTVKSYQISLPRAGYVDCNMTGGTIELTGRIRMGESSGHKGGVFNMSGGLIRFPNSGTYIDYLSVGHAAGSLMTFNMSGGTINTKGFAVGRGGPGTFNMTGGTLDVTVRTWVGELGGEGKYNLAGGNVTSDVLVVGYGAGPAAEVNVTGGTLSVSTLTVGRDSVGRCLIRDGTVTVNYLMPNPPAAGLMFLDPTNSSFVDVSGGQLIWAGGNYDSNVADFITAGKIRAYEGSGRVLHSYNNPDTVIEADDTARYPIPANNAVDVDTRWLTIVEWQNPFPGQTVCCDVYFGPGSEANMAKIVEHQDVNSAAVSLDPNTKYYWRVDTYDPVTDAKTTGVVWQFETNDVSVKKWHLSADLNKDGVVDILDFTLFTEDWLEEIGRGRIAITINHSKVAGNLSGFPVLVTGAKFPADFWEKAADDGRDIWFGLADGTILKREIAALDKDGKIFEAYVTIPLLSGSIDTLVYLNYGDWTVDKSMPGNVWDDNYKLVYHMNDANKYPNSCHIVHEFTTTVGRQGLATDGNYLYWGQNKGTGVNGAIHKITFDGVPVAEFVGPPHSAGGDFRQDHGTILFSTGGNDPLAIWEIDVNTGACIRSWDMTALANYGALVAYKEPNIIYILATDGVSWQYSNQLKIMEIILNDNGTYVIDGLWYGGSSWGTARKVSQGLDYEYGHLWYMYDLTDGVSRTIKISSLTLDSNGTVDIKDTISTDIIEEGEGMTWSHSGGEIYFGTGKFKIFKVHNPLAIEAARIKDSSNSANDAVKIGSYNSINVPAIAGYAQIFDGKSAYFCSANPSGFGGSNALTFEVWAKLDVVDADRRFFELNSGYFAFKPYYSGSSYKLAAGLGGNWMYSGNISEPRGAYHYFAAVWNGSQIAFYYDGASAGNASYSGSLGTAPNSLYIGNGDFSQSDYNKYLADGIMDEVRISNVPRSEAWITTTYNNISSPLTFYSVENQ